MPNKIVLNPDGSVSVRIDDVFINNATYLYEKNEKGNNFGSFGFLFPDEAKKTLANAVKQVQGATTDTVFGGQYPCWHEDAQYGKSLTTNGKMKFYLNKDKDEVPQNKAEDYIYSIEVTMSLSKKDGGIFCKVIRAFVNRPRNDRGNDSLFDDFFGSPDVPDIFK